MKIRSVCIVERLEFINAEYYTFFSMGKCVENDKNTVKVMHIGMCIKYICIREQVVKYIECESSRFLISIFLYSCENKKNCHILNILLRYSGVRRFIRSSCGAYIYYA